MDTALRLVRAYLRLNEVIWRRLRAAAVPLLALVGLATVIAWVIGIQTGNQLLLWSPAAYAWLLGGSYVLTRALDTPAGWTGPPRGHRR
ncbi:hypothetical protein [Streptomyces sp. NPDC057257]|uniref:hypothetical protein n=1 Tax=Streptomyces sp. NPDC057257 TaxID=3346071 RepID=UPI0036339A9C